MFLEYWMIALLAFWWMLSVYFITFKEKKKSFINGYQDGYRVGVNRGIDASIVTLKNMNVIEIDDRGNVIPFRENYESDSD